MNPNDSSFPYELTIGMIVKNEAHRLRGCLEGLATLRQSVPCELIITDTGSTDGTKDIAKEFADVYQEFVWCDDFSKARNTTTAIAQGRWYIYLDADHTFDDSILALADFLTSSQSYTPIEAATLSIRNYLNPQGTQFLDSTSCLLHNFSKGRKEFVYPIHECIQSHGEAPLIPTLIHHWGYLVEGEKQNRNHPILEKAIEKDPLNFHHHHHLIRDTKDLNLRKQRLDHAFACAKQDQNSTRNPFYWSICLSACQWAWESGDPVAFEQASGRLEGHHEETPLHLEREAMALSLALDQEDTEQVSLRFARYQSLYHRLQDRENLPFRSGFRYQFIQVESFYKLEVRCIKYLLWKEKKQEVLRLLERTTMLSQTLENGNHPYLGDYSNFAREVGGFSVLRSYHEYLVGNQCLSENNAYVLYLEQVFSSLSVEEKSVFLSVFSARPTTGYTSLWAVRKGGYQFGHCPPMALKILETTEDLYTNSLYRDVFYSSFRSKNDHFGFLSHSSLGQLLEWRDNLFGVDPQFHKLILQGLHSFAVTDTPLLKRNWGYLALGALVEGGKHTQQIETLRPYYEKTCVLLAEYVARVYQPQVVKEHETMESQSLFPPEERFALGVSQAVSLVQSDPDRAKKLLAQSLECYPEMKPFQALGLV